MTNLLSKLVERWAINRVNNGNWEILIIFDCINNVEMVLSWKYLNVKVVGAMGCNDSKWDLRSGKIGSSTA